MLKEKVFNKYEIKGPYHWRHISRAVSKRNLATVARYHKIIENIRDINRGKILDVGCGDGALCYLISKIHKGMVVGIDLSETGLKFGKQRIDKKKNISFIRASGYQLSFSNQSIDIVVASDIIEHLQDPERMLREICRVLKPGGTAIINSVVRIAEKSWDSMHVREYFPDEFKKLLCNYFSEVDIKLSQPLIWVELISKNYKGRYWLRMILNLVNLLFGFNPLLQEKGWIFYFSQTAIARKK